MINDLKKRLNSISGNLSDSVSNDSLHKEIKLLQEEVDRRLLGLKRQKQSSDSLAAQNSSGAFNGECYIIVASLRKKEQAEMWVAAHPDQTYLIKQNNRRSWFHVLLKDDVKRSEVGRVVYRKRKVGFLDAWWQTGDYFQ
jgi:hypothetical protein